MFAEILNLTLETRLTEDKQFGKKLEDGSWNGCVGMVHSGEADVCTMGLSWSIARSEAIDYSAHLRFPTGGHTLIGSRSQKRVLDMWAYLGVFGLIQGPFSYDIHRALRRQRGPKISYDMSKVL